jgi:hypothetical protein
MLRVASMRRTCAEHTQNIAGGLKLPHIYATRCEHAQNMRRTLQGYAIHARLYRGYTMRLLGILPTQFVWHTFGGLAN